MYRFIATLSLPALLFFATTQANAEKQWYKGNTHTHSLWSDGNDFPDMIVDWYASRDYHFLVLSDHNVLSQGERWMTVRDINRRGGALALDRYLKKFGDDWVEVRGNGASKAVRLKNLPELRKRFDKAGKFLLVQGEEITDGFEKLPVHINAINLQHLIKPQHGKSVRDTMQRNLDEVEKQSKATGKPILPHLNHPNFRWGITAEDIAAVTSERFFEVFNGHPGVNHRGDHLHAGVERLWDIANTLRIAKLNAPPLYGLATDDSHNYHERGGPSRAPSRSEPGRGWVMVHAEKLDADELVRAMQRGDFYASSGVTLESVTFDKSNSTYALKIKPTKGVRYVTQFIGTLEGYDDKARPVKDKNGNTVRATKRYSREVGAVLATVKGLNPTYKLTGKELYVRAVVHASNTPANPIWKDQVQQAWTQPVGWKDRVKQK